MDLSAIFDISAAGMSLQQLRLEVAAANLANAQTTSPDGSTYRPLQVVAHGVRPATFEALLDAARLAPADIAIVESETEPRMVFDPGHPDANERGFVAYPDVSPVSEMVRLIEINRAYEANVRAMNLAKSMALRALEIGADR
jgi:flagellar basal-body rod protein FlgC